MADPGPGNIDTTGYAGERGASGQGSGSSEGLVDTEFVKGPRGILKIVEMVFDLVTFICASIWTIWAWGAPWVQFVSMTSLVLTAMLYVMHTFKLPYKFPSAVHFRFADLIYTVSCTVCYFICGIVCAVSGWIPSVAAAAFFSFACMVLYGIDVYFTGLLWRVSGEGPHCL